MKAPIQKKQNQAAQLKQSEEQNSPQRTMSPPPLMLKTGDEQPTPTSGDEPGQGINMAADKSAGNEKVARLHIHSDIDVEKMGVGALMRGAVGHSWVSLEWKDQTAIPASVKTQYPKHAQYLQSRSGVFSDPFGFWPYMFSDYDEALDQWESAPDRVGYSSNPFDSYVKGQVVHPDTLHQKSVRATQSYDITESEALKVMAYEQSKQGSDYSVFYYNCTTFAKEAVEAAGKTSPRAGTLGVCYPNKLYNSIKKNQKKGRGNTTLYDVGATNPTTVEGDTSPGKRNY